MKTKKDYWTQEQVLLLLALHFQFLEVAKMSGKSLKKTHQKFLDNLQKEER